MKKIYSIAAIFTFLATAIAAGNFSLARAAADQANCDFRTADFTAIAAVQNDPTLTYDQELSQELVLRKQLLTKTITCAANDARSLQRTLDAVSLSTDPASVGIATTLAGRINDTLSFYTIEQAKVDGAGISATKAIAAEVLAWRTANYDPVIGQVNNFILWSQNQGLFQAAKNRVDQTGRIVTFIEAASGNSELRDNYAAAQAAFTKAWDDNQAAEHALVQLQSSDQSLALIQQSLQSLADTYQKFSDLNTVIQMLLPTGK
jgi:hypothetical protein